jgi:hypothetical protein
MSVYRNIVADTMRSSIYRPLWIVCTLLAVQPAIQAQNADPQPSVSLERIRAALQKEPSRLLPAPRAVAPTFRVEVRERDVLKPDDEGTFDPTYGLPSIGELLTDRLAKVHSAVVKHRRGRAKRRARNEVEDALAAFCATRECRPSRPRP